MAVMYYDVCDNAYKLDKDTFKLTILRRTEDGRVYEDEPTDYEKAKFDRHSFDRGIISEEIACRPALNLSLSY